jgi:hypothetical protein
MATPEEQWIEKALDECRKYAERIEFLARENGKLAKAIDKIGGDTAYLKELRDAADDVYRAADEADYGARGHLTQESSVEEGSVDRARYNASQSSGKKVSLKKAPWQDDETDKSKKTGLDEATLANLKRHAGL